MYIIFNFLLVLGNVPSITIHQSNKSTSIKHALIYFLKKEILTKTNTKIICVGSLCYLKFMIVTIEEQINKATMLCKLK